MELREKDIDISKDRKFIEVPVIIQTMKADGRAIDNQLSVHNAILYKNSDGVYYYVFEFITGLSVMNFSTQEYEKLQEIVPIENIPIFQKNGNLISKVSNEMRNK